MRLCHVSVAASGGSGKAVIDLIGQQVRQGHDATLIYALERTDLNLISKLPSSVQQVSLPMQRAVGVHDLVSLVRLYLCLRHLGPFDVIHSHSSKAGALARMVGILLPGVQVHTPHAFYSMQRGADSFYGQVEKWLSKLGKVIIVLSDVEKRHARDELRINPRKLHLIPNGIDINYPATRVTARQTMGYAENDIVIGSIGRFVPQKNLPCLIEAFAKVAKEKPDLKLVLIGSGEDEAKVEAALDQHNVRDQTRIFKGQNGRDLAPGLDGLLLGSDYEGFPLVFLEALAAGVPIVTTPVGGAKEAVIEGKTGFISPDFTANNLAEALLKLASLPAVDWVQMKANARQHAENFTLERMAERVQSVYVSSVHRLAP